MFQRRASVRRQDEWRDIGLFDGKGSQPAFAVSGDEESGQISEPESSEERARLRHGKILRLRIDLNRIHLPNRFQIEQLCPGIQKEAMPYSGLGPPIGGSRFFQIVCIPGISELIRESQLPNDFSIVSRSVSGTAFV